MSVVGTRGRSDSNARAADGRLGARVTDRVDDDALRLARLKVEAYTRAQRFRPLRVREVHARAVPNLGAYAQLVGASEVTERVEDRPDRCRRAACVFESEAAPQRLREHEVVERCATAQDELVPEQRICRHREGARGRELVCALTSRGGARRVVRRLVARRSVPLPRALEVFDGRVRAGEEEPFVPVVAPPNEERRAAVLAVHLEDLRIAVVLADMVTLDHQAVSDLCSHRVLPSPAGRSISVRPQHDPGPEVRMTRRERRQW